MVDIAELTDDELRERLAGYGVNVGPIVSTTRLFYEKRLGKLIDSGGVLPERPEPESEEEDDEEEEEDEEVHINYSKEPQMYSPPPQARTYQAPTGYTPITQQRRASPTRAATATHRTVTSTTSQAPRQTSAPTPRQTSAPTPDKKTTKKSGGFALWIKLLFVIIVAILVYLVIINVNPSAQNKIPMSLETEEV